LLVRRCEKLHSHVNHVRHAQFRTENRENFYALVGDYFYPDDKDFVRSEIPPTRSEDGEELNVALPDDNLTFTSCRKAWPGTCR